MIQSLGVEKFNESYDKTLRKEQKEAIVQNYSGAFTSTPSFLLINYSGAKVSEFESLRKAFNKLDTASPF